MQGDFFTLFSQVSGQHNIELSWLIFYIIYYVLIDSIVSQWNCRTWNLAMHLFCVGLKIFLSQVK